MRIFYIAALLVIFFLLPQAGSALSLRQISDVVTRLKINTPSDHTIQFTMSGGMATGTIRINFNEVIGSTNDIDYRDIDFAYGAPGLEREQVLLTEPSTNIWGASINPGTKILTLTFPTANATPLVTGDRAVVKIGSHAQFGKPDTYTLKQMINNETQGSKQVDITAGTDTGALAIPLIGEDSIGITGNILKMQLTITSSNKVLITLLGGVRAATGYRIERSRDGIAYSSIAEIPQTKREYEDRNVEPNTTYYYRIVPYNTTGTLGIADQGIVTTPQAATLTQGISSQIQPTSFTQQQAPTTTITPQPSLVPTPFTSLAPTPSIATKTPIVEQKDLFQTLPNISSLRFEVIKSTTTFFWKNPTDMKNRQVIVVRSEKKFPRSLSEGVRMYQGAAEQFGDTGLISGSTYYYTFFVSDTTGNISSGSIISVTISSPIVFITSPSPTPLPTTSSQITSSPVPSPSPVQEPQVLTVNLASPLKQIIQPDLQQTFVMTNTQSNGGEQTLRVDIPANLSDKPFDLTIVPIAKTQSYLFDEHIRFPQDKEFIGELFDVSARQDGKHLKKFTKTIRLTFNYNEKLFKNISPEHIKVHYWDPLTEKWNSLENTYVDTEEKLVVVEVDVDHFTLFAVMASKSAVSKQDIPQRVVIQQDVPINIAREIKQQKIELPLDAIRVFYAGTLQSLVSHKKGWYAVKGEYVNICIPKNALPQNSEYVSTKIFSNEFFLTDDQQKNCFTAQIQMPESTGEYEGIFKIVTTDDRITKIPFTISVVSSAQESLMVYGEQFFKSPLQNPASILAFITMLLMLIAGAWYIVRRRFQYSQD